MHELSNSFRFAGRGLWFALKERNLRLHLLAAASAVSAGVWFEIHAWQWGLLILAITLVIVAEMVNTALECVVDLASPGYADLARMAKDVAAGAVLFTALAALALANVVFAAVLRPELQRLRDGLSRLPTSSALVLFAVLLMLLYAGLLEWGSRQRRFALVAALLAAIGARAFTVWPSLPLVTISAFLLFAVWVMGHYRRVMVYTLLSLNWVLFLVWFWQRGM